MYLYILSSFNTNVLYKLPEILNTERISFGLKKSWLYVNYVKHIKINETYKRTQS